ncbi:MAG: gliding motility-associated C-terminal domain-containing protein [Bacteroidetes bacterium]|nr:gliding motility-associated C-terminal domain-containing protein [Bacteroidota bacterium]
MSAGFSDTEGWLKNKFVYLEPNLGQIKSPEGFDQDIYYAGHFGTTRFFVTNKGLVYYLSKPATNTTSRKDRQQLALNVDVEKTGVVLDSIAYFRFDMLIEGANIDRNNIVGEEPSIESYNYYLGHCPKGVTQVKKHKKITIRNVYPGIDWVLYGINENGLKYDFVVHPGANANQIQLKYDGIDEINTLENNQSIQFETPFGKIQEGKLFCFQNEKKIAASYQIQNNNVHFNVSNYDKHQQLVIDPPVLIWGTFFGGSNTEDMAFDITTHNGYVYVAGETIEYTAGTGFPTVNPGGTAYVQAYDEWDDFILKFDTTGVLLWVTYYGGTSTEQIPHVTVDNSGNLYMTGNTFSAADFPTQSKPGAYNQLVSGGSREGFVVKFDNTGTRLWATFVGGSLQEFPREIKTDNLGNKYVTGRVNSTNMPLVNPGGGAYFDGTHNGGVWDFFIWKFDAADSLVWSTYYGGTALDEAMAIDIDNSNNLWLVGMTTSTNIPTQNLTGAYNQVANAGQYDAFAIKFNSSHALVWASYVGGSAQYDMFYDVDASVANDIVMVGASNSTNFPTMNPGGGAFFQGTLGTASTNNYRNCVIVKLDNNAAMQWSTYYGGSNPVNFPGDEAWGVVTDNAGDVWVTGSAISVDFPTDGCGGYFKGNVANGEAGESFLLQFSNASARKHATFCGSTLDQDAMYGISFSAPQTIFLTGFQNGINPVPPLQNPGGGAYYQAVKAGGTEVIIQKYRKIIYNPIAQATVSDSVICVGDSINFSDLSYNYYTPVTKWNWSFQGSAVPTSSQKNPANVYYTNQGVYSVTLIASNFCEADTIYKNLYITVNPLPTVQVSPLSVCSGVAADLTASGATSYSWSPSTGLSATIGASVTCSITTATNYTVTGTDALGCVSSSSLAISVVPQPTVSISINDTVCNGQSATITAGGGTNYSWSNGSTTSAINVSPSVSTIYTVSVSNGFCMAKDSATIFSEAAIAAISGTSSICSGSSATLSAAAATNYLWSIGGTGTSIVVSPTTNSLYSLTVFGQYCLDTSSIAITVDVPPTLSVSSNTTICAGQLTTISASGAANYSWSNGSTTASVSISPTSNTTYTVSASNGVCPPVIDSVTIQVMLSPTADAGIDQIVCASQTATITASGGVTYLWSTGQTTATVIVTPVNTAVYNVTVSNGNCSSVDFVTITASSPAVDAGNNTTIPYGQSVALNATGGVTYSWSPGAMLSCTTCASPLASPTVSTMYYVEATDNNNCTAIDSVYITVETPCDQELFVPNAFSPNNDGQNDNLEIKGVNCVLSLHVTLYNRWGQKVFETTNPKEYWTGYFQNKPADTGVYSYLITGSDHLGSSISLKGNVSLIR